MIHNARVEVNNEKLWVVCSCGEFTRNCGTSLSLSEFTIIHSTHLDNARRRAFERERDQNYDGPERREARPARVVLPEKPPPAPTRGTSMSLPSDLNERLERLERLMLSLLSQPDEVAGVPLSVAVSDGNGEFVGTREATPEEIKIIWGAAETPKLTCRCDGPEHEETCYKRYA